MHFFDWSLDKKSQNRHTKMTSSVVALLFAMIMIIVSINADRCVLEKDPGPCYAYVPRWHYNSDSGHCERFIYGNCRGNANNFKTKSDCESACPNCRLPAVSGRCMAYFENYYYDNNEGRCKKFIYGGCGGNSNNFKTRDDCRKACQ